MMENYLISDIPPTYWKAISTNDSDFDNMFFYGVKTTKIFCRPSCKSRLPNRQNVFIFNKAQAALELGFRPCKRCKPDNLLLPNEEWIGQVCEWIDVNFQRDITLNFLSEIFHSSPFHLQRTFNNVKGVSPLAYIQQKRLTTAAKKLIDTNDTIQFIASEVGYPNHSYFSTVFKRYFNVTPHHYRKQYR